jgi:cystathionine beta-lyase/cystathionine gamma-synthase
MSDNKELHIESIAIHSGTVPQDGTFSVTTPIYPTSTYREPFPGDDSGYVYSRWSNPTRLALEKALAAMEQGTNAKAFSSGLAAVGAVINLLSSGDHVVAVDDLYGGCHRLFERLLRPQFKLDFSYVDGRDPANFEKACKPNTKLFWVETPTNPLLKLADIGAIAEIAHKRNILLAVDNTFATPYIQTPLNLGADIVHHSMSKYLSGHCDVIGGAIITKDKALGEKIFFNQYAVGAILDPFQAWLVLRGIKTLHVRMERHSFNAQKIAKYLKTQKKVSKVYFPGFDGKPLPNRMKLPGGMVSFELDADFEVVKKFVMSTKQFILAESLGGVESLINHPATMTHASIPKEIREQHGISDQLIRLSVGIEHIDDLLADLQQAFAAIG